MKEQKTACQTLDSNSTLGTRISIQVFQMRQLLRTIGRLRNSLNLQLVIFILVSLNLLLLFLGCDFLSFGEKIPTLDDAISHTQSFVTLPLERLPNMNTNLDMARNYIEPLDSDSIELFDYRGSTSYHPVNLIHRVQMFIAAYHKTNDSLLLRRAQEYTNKLLSLAYVKDTALFLPYGFRYAVHSDSSNTFETPWYSGMAQGEFLIILARLFEITSDNRYLLAGQQTLNSLAIIQGSGKEPWVSRIDNNGYFWIEEYPHEINPGRTLNGYMAAVYGLYDYYRVTKSPLAKELYDLSLTTIKHYLPFYRVSGNNSWYCLGHNHRATDGYHQLHINMLINLNNMTGDPFFRVMKDVFELDQQSTSG